MFTSSEYYRLQITFTALTLVNEKFAFDPRVCFTLLKRCVRPTFFGLNLTERYSNNNIDEIKAVARNGITARHLSLIPNFVTNIMKQLIIICFVVNRYTCKNLTSMECIRKRY